MRRKKYNVLNLNKTVELATIETIDSILWLAHYKTTNGLICRPKYIPDCSGLITINFKQYKRLYSPIFKENSDVRNLGYNSIDHDLLFKGLFFIPFRKIKRIYPISRFTPNVRQTTTAKEGQKFLENIICRSPHEKRNIFFMGSISLNCESDGYSDLDVAISDSNTFNRVLCSLNKISGVTFRTKDAWDSFYVKYGVKTLVSKNDFSCSMLNKKNQGFYNKIPFTIFCVRKNLRTFNSRQISYDYNYGGRGIIINESEKNCFPAVWKIKIGYFVYYLESWDRFFQGVGRKGQTVKFNGIKKGKTIYIVPGKGWIQF